jgi:disulfide bond formation protein DsbB
MSFGAVTDTLASLSLLSGGLGVLLLATLALPGGRSYLRREARGRERLLVGLAWGVAAISTAGSLYYSQVVGFLPCVLCWYQRIAMYPLVLLLAVGLVEPGRATARYGLPLSIGGLAVALYHVMIQLRPALEATGVCDASVPCTARYLSVYGFVSIPVMAAGGFLLITGLLATVWIVQSGEPSDG